MWTANPDILTTDLGDELVLMNPQRSVMFSLNAAGRLLWQALPAAAEDLAALLQQTYALPASQAEADTHALLQTLHSRDLIRSA